MTAKRNRVQTDYQPQLIAQRVKNACVKWLRPLKWTATEVVEDVCMEYYVALLSYKPKRWVTCHQPQSLEDAVLMMEAYMAAEAGIYLRKTSKNKPPRPTNIKGCIRILHV